MGRARRSWPVTGTSGASRSIWIPTLDRRVVRRLASRSDVVVSSFRPGSLAKRGLDYESLREDNEGLVYCSITAYGPKGPKKDAPGYDPVLQAETGLMSMTGHPDGPAARMGVGVIDLGTGMWAAVGIQAALQNRRQSGVGALVEVSLYETAAWLLSYHVEGYLATGESPQRQGNGTPFVAPYETFATADGDLMVTAGNDQLFVSLCRVLGLSDLADDPAYVAQCRSGGSPHRASYDFGGPLQREARRGVAVPSGRREGPVQPGSLSGRPRTGPPARRARDAGRSATPRHS